MFWNMESIGHFEFGSAHRPIDMGGWLAEAGDLSPFSADYWLAYWARTFEALLAQQTKQMVFVSYERCCAAATHSLEALADVWGSTIRRHCSPRPTGSVRRR